MVPFVIFGILAVTISAGVKCDTSPLKEVEPIDKKSQCSLNTDCADDLACIRNHCVDPCPGTCGYQANCSVAKHIPVCSCNAGYTGDPFTNCNSVPQDKCNPLVGDPNTRCSPECVLNNECPNDKACVRYECVNPCESTCAPNALCTVNDHIPMCRCPSGVEGNPLIQCGSFEITVSPCIPSPCGSYSLCRAMNNQPVCSCLPGYVGSPPTCHPASTVKSDRTNTSLLKEEDEANNSKIQCVNNTNCAESLACIKEYCVSPCDGVCGVNAECSVRKHVPICRCPSGMSGDPYINCKSIVQPVHNEYHVCVPSPCGNFSLCREIDNLAVCSCLPGYIGSPPTCHPAPTVNSDRPNSPSLEKNDGVISPKSECSINANCADGLTCINQRCVNPCDFGICDEIKRPEVPKRSCVPEQCQRNAECRPNEDHPDVISCHCKPGYKNTVLIGCVKCETKFDCDQNKDCIKLECVDPCPGACSSNDDCYVFNHKASCRPKSSNPECSSNTDCSDDKACDGYKCVDPCLDLCSKESTDCQVLDHKPNCTCKPGFYGSPYRFCLRNGYVE